MTMHYFAQDGNFGDAEDLKMIDTTEWTAFEWDLVENAHDTDRASVALEIDETHELKKRLH